METNRGASELTDTCIAPTQCIAPFTYVPSIINYSLCGLFAGGFALPKLSSCGILRGKHAIGLFFFFLNRHASQLLDRRRNNSSGWPGFHTSACIGATYGKAAHHPELRVSRVSRSRSPHRSLSHTHTPGRQRSSPSCLMLVEAVCSRLSPTSASFLPARTGTGCASERRKEEVMVEGVEVQCAHRKSVPFQLW